MLPSAFSAWSNLAVFRNGNPCKGIDRLNFLKGKARGENGKRQKANRQAYIWYVKGNKGKEECGYEIINHGN